MKVIPKAQSSVSMSVTWSYDVGDEIPETVTIHEFGPDGAEMDSKNGLAPVAGIALFTGLKPSISYGYLWCGVFPSTAGNLTICLADRVIGTTLASSPPVPPVEPYPPPSITSLDPEPATITQGNSITVSWSSTIHYDRFLVWWTRSGIAQAQGEIDAGGYSGNWAAQTVPGYAYTFAMNGGVGYTWGAKYSGWGPTATMTAVPNLTSLRQFLQHSGLEPAGQHLRSLLPAGVTLRTFMRL